MKKMIIIEDDIITQKVYERLLGKTYDLRIFDSAESFFESFNKNPCDIIIIDIGLKGVISGLEITREIKSNSKYKHIPIICVTAFARYLDEGNALTAGVNEFFTKPVSINLLLETLSKY